MRQNDIVAVMVTVDRSPKTNYLGRTVQSLLDSDLNTSERLDRLLIFDSKSYSNYISKELGLLTPEWHSRVRVYHPLNGTVYNAAQNVSQALKYGWIQGRKWVLFLEDDIEVCKNFFDSVGKWLDEHEDEKYRIYSFGANYPQVTINVNSFWEYPIEKFYGTQCFAIRCDDAKSLSEFLITNEFSTRYSGAYDISMHHWMNEKYQNLTHFLASVPSFVNHIGEESFIRPGGNHFTFNSFQGKEWSYT